MIAPTTPYSVVLQAIPGLSYYYYKEARRYSLLFGAGRPAPTPTQIRIRYDKNKVASFVSYITSPHVVFDLPYGTAKVVYSSGESEEIARLQRISRNQRIAEQYLNYLRENELNDLSMSRSSLLRILKYCTADTRKSLHGLDYYTFAGLF